MAAPLNQLRTSIVDMPEEDRELAVDRELAADELLLIVGGATGCENEGDTQNTGNRDCDAPKMF
jgi:hypothetical protein